VEGVKNNRFVIPGIGEHLLRVRGLGLIRMESIISVSVSNLITFLSVTALIKNYENHP
jgi:hypothetical protein